MRRGELAIVSAQGDYGKPRPALIIQSGSLLDQMESITVCFLTTEIVPTKNFRVTLEPDGTNGLRERSQVQIEKIMTFPRAKVRGPIGHLTAAQMRDVDRFLMIFLDLLPPFEISSRP
jgi:mRNA interferase MazF